MGKGRIEAFSDGVIAIIITIMVLEIKVPHGETWEELYPLIPVFMSYILSFIFVGIYRNNHHHLFHATKQVNGWVLWANMHLLFWLSLIPFATGWMGELYFAPTPVLLYGIVILMAGVAYYLLARALVNLHGAESHLAKAIGNDVKGKISVVLYIAGILVSFVNSWASVGIYVLVAIMWFIPDRRIEKALT